MRTNKMRNMILDILKSNWANLFYLLSLILSVITLLVLVEYASDTKTLAVQSQRGNLANLRPLIERSGIVNWDNVILDPGSKDFNPLTFRIFKNVATSINGYIVVNGYKYKLLFASKVSQVAPNSFGYYENWGWIAPDTDATLWAGYNKDSKQATSDPNLIYVSYADIEGNRYCTLDDATLSNPRSFSCDK